MCHLFVSGALRIISKCCFAYVQLCPCLLYCNDFFLTRPFLSFVLWFYLRVFFVLFLRFSSIHPFVHCSGLSPDYLVHLVQMFVNPTYPHTTSFSSQWTQLCLEFHLFIVTYVMFHCCHSNFRFHQSPVSSDSRWVNSWEGKGWDNSFIDYWSMYILFLSIFPWLYDSVGRNNNNGSLLCFFVLLFQRLDDTGHDVKRYPLCGALATLCWDSWAWASGWRGLLPQRRWRQRAQLWFQG